MRKNLTAGAGRLPSAAAAGRRCWVLSSGITKPCIEITHRGQYFELTGQTLPTSAELQSLTAGLPAVIIPGVGQASAW